MKLSLLGTAALFLAIGWVQSLEFSAELTEATKNTLVQQHAAFLKNRKAAEDGKPVDAGLTSVDQGIQQHTDNLATCDAGYGGPNCSPVCSNKVPLRSHDGLNLGEAIELKSSYECSENVSIPVDSYVVDLIVSVYSLSLQAKPLAYLYTPSGAEVLPTDENLNDPDVYQARFARITTANGFGMYTLQIKSLDTVPCSYQVTAASTAVFDAGFVTSAFDDNVLVNVYSPWKVLREPTISTASYLVAQPSGVAFPGTTTSIAFYNGDDLQYPPQPVSPRFNCSASLTSSLYMCSRSDFYVAKFRGYDDQGNSFQRAYTFGCGSSGTVGPPPTDPPPDQCINGGTPIVYGVNNMTCLCTAYFTGSECQTKLCFNGGFLNLDGVCECATGFSGNSCTDLTCTVPARGSYELDSRALIFVVRTTNSMSDNLPMIASTATQIIGEANTANPGYYRAYVLVGFGNNGLTTINESTDPNLFLAAVKNMSVVLSTTCNDTVYGGLAAAVTTESAKLYKRSPIFLFTDALPNDPQDTPALYASLNDFEGPIFTIFPYSSSSTCPVNLHDTRARDLRRLAQFTHGHVANLPLSNASDVVFNLAQGVENTASLAMNDFVDQCSLGSKYTSFFVDDTTGQVFVTATGSSLTITMYNTNNKQILPVMSKNVGNVYIYRYNSLVKGNYLLMIGSDGNSPCQFRVLGDSGYKLFLGTAKTRTTDLSFKAPFYNELTNIVARVNRVFYSTPAEVYAEAVIWSNDYNVGERTVLYAGNGLYRDQCDFHFLFERFKCARQGVMFYISIYLTDRIGYTIQRVRSSYCATPMVVPTSPDGCQNGGAVDHNTPNATCSCPIGWTGNFCQTIICQNYGTSQHTYCSCRAGYTGQFCEITACTSTSYEEFSPFRRSITFFVHDSRTTATMIQSMNKQISQTIQDVTQQHPRFINQYTLVTFDDVKQNQRIMTSNASQFVSAFNSFAAENLQNQKVSCTELQVLQSLYLYLTLTSTEKYGLYYVFMRGIMHSDLPTFDQVQLLLETTQSQINFVNADAYPCNTPLTDPGPQLMWTLAAISGGQVYIVSLPNAAGAMKTIPLQFRTGLIYEKYVDDCSAASGVNFYFPIDSETQAVSVLIDADLNRDPVYTYPNGTADKNFVTTIYTDYGVSTRLDQIIAPCDGLYRNLENRCWLFMAYTATWAEARDSCVKQGAVLATIFDATVENYLYGRAGNIPFWTGLNDMANSGIWVWDQGVGQAALPLTGYTNWAAGQPNINGGQCVSDSSAGKWTVSDCTTVKAFACVKSAYNSDYMPSSPSANSIYQGIWALNVQSYTGSCFVSVWGQSSIQVFTAYVKDTHSDFGAPFPTSGNVTNYIATHVSGLSSFTDQNTGSLQYAHIYPDKTNTQLTFAQKYTTRDFSSCKHQYVTSGFSCPGYAFSVMHTGVDRYGYAFQRITPALCYQQANTTCLNGGVFYDNKCVCPPHYGGQLCQMPFCVNGNLAPNYITCNCANTDFTGTFCEVPLCVNGTAAAPQETTKNKTLVIILDGSYTLGMQDVLNNLNSVLDSIITNTTNLFPGWIGNYIGVVAFDSARNGSISSNKVSETDKNAFITNLAAQATSANYSSPQAGRALFSAITLATSGADLKERSIVYVISAGNAEDYALLDPALDLISFTHPTVHMIFVGDQNAPGNASYRDPPVDALHEFSFVTGGGFYQVANYTQLQSFWYKQIATAYITYNVAYNGYRDCSQHTIYVQIGASNTKLIVDMFTMIASSVTIVDSQGNNYGVQNVVRTRTNYLFTVEPPNGGSVMPPGIYTITLNSTNTNDHPFCTLAIRGISSQSTYLAFTQDLGYDNGQHSNTANLSPTSFPPRSAVIVESDFGSVQFIQFYDLREQTLLWATPVIARQNCQYGYISKEAFSCPAASFAVAIDGVDDGGHPYRRVQNAHCKGFSHNSTGGSSLEQSTISFASLMAKL